MGFPKESHFHGQAWPVKANVKNLCVKKQKNVSAINCANMEMAYTVAVKVGFLLQNMKFNFTSVLTCMFIASWF